jgi:hypothetical protein
MNSSVDDENGIPTETRWRRSQLAETFATVRVSPSWLSPVAWHRFILLFLEARIVCRDALRVE